MMNFTPKNAEQFYCDKCDFKCSKPSDWGRHITTRKHIDTYKILTNSNEFYAENSNVTNNYNCECGKEYKHRQSLWNHKKKCVTSCISPELINLNGNKCVSQCEENQLIDITGKKCVSSCGTNEFISSDSTKCVTSCISPELINLNGNKCTT